MKPNATHIAADVQALMIEARRQMAARLHELFQAAPMIAAIGEERAKRLVAHTALGGATLGWVSSEVHEAIIEARAENKLGRWTLWHIIDAIGNIGDCAPGRWPYITDANRRIRLQWASEELVEAEKAVIEAIRQATPASAAELVAA